MISDRVSAKYTVSFTDVESVFRLPHAGIVIFHAPIMISMFPYDQALAAAVQAPPQSIADVLQTMRTIDALCADDDGLKWFNWLYLQVTNAVEARVSGGGFADPAWLAELDVQFARLYFSALGNSLAGLSCPACWQILFSSRTRPRLARIQFALAGINAHINHDLPQAIVIGCEIASAVPQHGTTHYNDYSALNTTLDNLVETAKRTLMIRLLGESLAPVSYLENTIAAWNVKAAREKAWINAELLWHLKGSPTLAAGFMDTLDGFSTVVGKNLLVPVP